MTHSTTLLLASGCSATYAPFAAIAGRFNTAAFSDYEGSGAWGRCALKRHAIATRMWYHQLRHTVSGIFPPAS